MDLINLSPKTEQNSQTPPPQEISQDNAGVEPKKPKRKSKKLLILGLIILFLIVGIAVILFLLQPRERVVEQPSFVITQNQQDKQWEKFSNAEFNFEVEYPIEATFSKDASLDPVIYRILFKGEKETKINIDDRNIEDGYIFRVSVYPNLDNTNIADLIQKRLEAYRIFCPENSNFGQITDTNVTGKIAKTFEITECNLINYRETYVLDRGNVFQLTQVYRGDLGFRQAYRGKLTEIQQKFNFINIPPSQTQWITFTSTKYFSFEHPTLDLKCCSRKLGGNSKVIAVAANSADFGNKISTSYDSVSFFSIEEKTIPYENVIQNEKARLIEEYKIVNNRTPINLVEENITVDGQPAIRLKGYSWWADEIVYIDSGTKGASQSQNRILVVAKTETYSGSFVDFDRIFNSIKFIKE